MKGGLNVNSPKASLAFIGLGVMGGPMAGHLARAGHRVVGYNRSPEKAQRWANAHAQLDIAIAQSPREAAEGADLVVACVGNDEDLKAITLGPQGAFQTMQAGSIFLDHTTASAALARELGAQARSKGLHFLDAPVSGGELGAINGTLTVMAGGDQNAFDIARPVAQAYSRAFTRIGENGSGQLAKMVNQICVTAVIQGLAEGLSFGKRAGLDMKLVLEVITKGAAQSWQMEHRGPTMLDGKFDFGFAVDWMRKDLGLCLQEAQRLGASLPVTALIDQFYAEIQAMGKNRWDTSSLITRLDTPRH
jgi:3-hydroxyisobutyrate dehydrogenase